MKILITGGAGFIGSHLVSQLVSLGHRVSIIDNLESGKTNNLNPVIKKIKIINANIRDESIIKKATKVDVIFHLAGKITVLNSFAHKKEFEEVNVKATFNLLDQALKNKVKKFVFASSAAVYGNNIHIPLCENDAKNPISPLGQTKLKAEEHCQIFREKGLDTTILRFFNVYGKNQNLSFDNIISGSIDRITHNQAPIVYGDGKQTRDFIYIEDVVRACIKSLNQNSKHFIFNIGTGKETSINELLKNIFHSRRQKVGIEYVDKRKGEICRSVACICQAEKYLKFKPKFSLIKGLNQTISP